MKISIEITGSPHRGPSALTSLASGMLAGAATSLFASLLHREPRGHDEAFDDCDGKGGKVPFGISFDVPKDAPVAPASGGDGLMSMLASVLSSLGPILSATMSKSQPPHPAQAKDTQLQLGKCPWCGGDAISLEDPTLMDKATADSFECAACKKPIKVVGDDILSDKITFAKVEPASPAAETAKGDPAR